MKLAGRAARTLLLIAASVGIAAGQDATTDLRAFDTATIKPAQATDGSWGMHFTETGFIGRGVDVSLLLDEAYGFDWRSEQVSLLEKKWLDRRFDVDARMDGGNQATFARMSTEQRQALLRQLLVERFHLTLAEETPDRDVFLLVLGKARPHLGPALSETAEEQLRLGLVRQSGPGLLVAERLSMESLAMIIKETVGRIVLDRTGLPGRYGFALHWSAEGENSSQWPDLPIALEEQLGLRLVPAKVPLRVVVVSHIEEPSKN